jgi:hypothetical protein
MFMVEHGFFNEGDPELKYDPHLWRARHLPTSPNGDLKKERSKGSYLIPIYQFELVSLLSAVQWYKGEFFKSCKSQGIDVPR